MTAALPAAILEALSTNGRLPLAAIAAHHHIAPALIKAALDEIAAAGIRLQCDEGCVELDEAAQPEPTSLGAVLGGAWPENPVATGMAAQRVPGQPTCLAKRMRRRMDRVKPRVRPDFASLAPVTARLAELGVEVGGLC